MSQDSLSPAEEENKAKGEALAAKYEAAMEDDFNTADAISAVFELIKLAQFHGDGGKLEGVCFLAERGAGAALRGSWNRDGKEERGSGRGNRAG